MTKSFRLRMAQVISAVVVVLTMAGCAALSGQWVLTLERVHIDVSWKMTAYRQAVIAGSVTEAQAQQVNAAYDAYQQAFQRALAAAGGNLQAPTPPDLKARADQVIAAVAEVLATLT